MKKIIVLTLWVLLTEFAVEDENTTHSHGELTASTIKTLDEHPDTITKKAALNTLYNTNWKSSSRDSLKRYLDPIFQPICAKYAHMYNVSPSTLVACIETMATSESGNSKGQPFSSILFKRHNNPFGIKGTGCNVETVEYYNNVRTVITDGFRHFNTLEDAITYLVGDLLTNDRYKRVRTSRTVEEFFYNLKSCGYFTDPSWHKRYLIPTCNKYYL